MKEQTIFKGTERNLLAAILSQALKDSQKPDPSCAAEAQIWIAETGIFVARYLGFSQEAVQPWLTTLPAFPAKPTSFGSEGGYRNVAQ